MTDTEDTASVALLRRPLAQLAGDVQAGRLSARELVQASLDAISARDGVLQAFVAVDAERALAEAAEIDRRIAAGEQVGSLAGIPLAVKDNDDAAGFTTSHGSALHRGDPPAGADSPLVARLRGAGCVVVGKVNTPEHAYKGDTVNGWGQGTGNPWNPERSAGGSSGGSASAVAGGLVPLATGSDGGGSIRIPAALCGLSGLKPSLGRVPSGGARPAGWIDMSTKGVLAGSIRDTAYALDAVVGPDPTDLRSLPKPDVPWSTALDAVGAPLRVAWSPTLGYARVDAEVLAVCESAVRRLAELGAEVVEVPEVWDHDPVDDWLPVVATCNERTIGRFRGTDDWERIDPGLRFFADYAMQAYSPLDIVRSFDAAHVLNLRLVEVFREHTLLLCPTVAGQTPRLGADGGLINGVEDRNWVQLTYGFNLTRSPAGTVCAGFTADGMPVGLQVVGPQHGDMVVLRALALLEDQLALDRIPPAYRS